eukprot:1631249-Pleurochrysis_carterae.AAC.1
MGRVRLRLCSRAVGVIRGKSEDAPRGGSGCGAASGCVCVCASGRLARPAGVLHHVHVVDERVPVDGSSLADDEQQVADEGGRDSGECAHRDGAPRLAQVAAQ